LAKLPGKDEKRMELSKTEQKAKAEAAEKRKKAVMGILGSVALTAVWLLALGFVWSKFGPWRGLSDLLGDRTLGIIIKTFVTTLICIPFFMVVTAIFSSKAIVPNIVMMAAVFSAMAIWLDIGPVVNAVGPFFRRFNLWNALAGLLGF